MERRDGARVRAKRGLQALDRSRSKNLGLQFACASYALDLRHQPSGRAICWCCQEDALADANAEGKDLDQVPQTRLVDLYMPLILIESRSES